MDYSSVTAEGALPALRAIVETVSRSLPVTLLKAPAGAMLMVRHVDPLGGTPFYLGEAYVTECEVEVDGCHGYGCVLGTETERALCAAVVDALVGEGHPFAAKLEPLLDEEARRIQAAEAERTRAAATTRVNFEVR